MISEIINHFKESVAIVNEDLRYDGFVFQTLKDSSLVINDTYKLIIGALSSQRQDTAIQATIPVSVIIWQKSSRSEQEQDFINIYCEGVEIQSTVVAQDRIDQSYFIKAINSSTVTPSPVDSNDNTIQVTIDFEVTIIYNVNAVQ